MSVEEWKPAVFKIAGHFRRKNRHLDFDDLVQEGWIGVMDALARFDPAKGAQLSTFVNYRIRSRMMDLARNERIGWPVRGSRKQDGFNQVVELDHAVPVRDDAAIRIIAEVEAGVTNDKLLAGSPERSKRVLELYFRGGYRMSEIARMFHRSEAWVSLLVGQTIRGARLKACA